MTASMMLVAPILAQEIREFPLDVHVSTDVPVSREITTITFPGPITAVAGADMLIEGGRASGIEIEATAPLRFHVTHAPGSNFILARSLQPNAVGRLTLIYEGGAYILQLRAVANDSVASAIFRSRPIATAVKVPQPSEPVRFTPRIGLSLLDRARAYPLLIHSLPRAVEGVTRRAHGQKIELPELEIEVQETFRFTREDAVVFLLLLRNRTDSGLEIAPETFVARIGNEKFSQAIAQGPRRLEPGETAAAEFAIVGLPGGTRNDLSADNAFTILVNARRRDVTADSSAEEEP